MQQPFRRFRLATSAPPGLDDLPVVAGAFGLVAGIAGLLGSRLGPLPAMPGLPGALTMDAATAAGFVLLGLALVLARRALAARERGGISAIPPLGTAAALVLVVASLLLTLAVWIVDPARLTTMTVLGLLFSAAGIGLAVVRRLSRLAAGLVVLAFVIGALNALDLLFEATAPSVLEGSGLMAFSTALVFIVLSVGTIGLLPIRAWLGTMAGPSASARNTRRLVTASLVVPVALAWLRLQGEAHGLYGIHYGASLIVLGTFLFLTVMVVRTARSSQRTDTARQAAIEERDRFFEVSIDLLATANASGTFVRLNPAWTAVLGYELEELMSRPFVEFVHPDDVDATNREVVRQIHEGRSVLNFQNRYRHRDGSYRWLEWTSAPSADGALLYAVARDITERKRAEEELHAPALALAQRRAAARDRIATIIATAGFAPVYQPIVDIPAGMTVGYEALTRFGDGSRPDEVFATARECGLGIELETATLRAALAGARTLPSRAWLSLNVSPTLLADVPTLGSVLGPRSRLLVLEVTEHESIEAYQPLRDAAIRLGPEVRLAVDDAGAGVANFNHLVELRPDFVKIDIGLVRGVDSDVSRQAVMAGIVHFAAPSGCQVIAEGIETDAELKTITELGVTLGQGYLLGRPAPAADWLGSRRMAPRRAGGRRIDRAESLPRAIG